MTQNIQGCFVCFTVFRMKIEQNSCVIVKLDAILGVFLIYPN